MILHGPSKPAYVSHIVSATFRKNRGTTRHSFRIATHPHSFGLFLLLAILPLSTLDSPISWLPPQHHKTAPIPAPRARQCRCVLDEYSTVVMHFFHSSSGRSGLRFNALVALFAVFLPLISAQVDNFTSPVSFFHSVRGQRTGRLGYSYADHH